MSDRTRTPKRARLYDGTTSCSWCGTSLLKRYRTKAAKQKRMFCGQRCWGAYQQWERLEAVYENDCELVETHMKLIELKREVKHVGDQ